MIYSHITTISALANGLESVCPEMWCPNDTDCMNRHWCNLYECSQVINFTAGCLNLIELGVHLHHSLPI